MDIHDNDIENALSIESDRFTDIARSANLDPEDDFTICDLRGISIDVDEDLSNYNFSYSDLSDSTLFGVDLSKVNLSMSNLTGADLSYAILRGLDLSKTNLSRANLTGADLREVQLPDNFLFWCNQNFTPFPMSAYLNAHHDDSLYLENLIRELTEDAIENFGKDNFLKSGESHLEICRLNYFLRSDDFATISENLIALSRCALALGCEQQGEHLFRTAMDLSVISSDHTEAAIAVGYNNLGYILYQKGQRKRAKEAFEKAFFFSVYAFGAEHNLAADCYNNLGYILQEGLNFSIAERMFRISLEARINSLGDGHPDTILSYNNVASALREQGLYSEAETYYKKALELSEIILGKSHETTKKIRKNIENLVFDAAKK